MDIADHPVCSGTALRRTLCSLQGHYADDSTLHHIRFRRHCTILSDDHYGKHTVFYEPNDRSVRCANHLGIPPGGTILYQHEAIVMLRRDKGNKTMSPLTANLKHLYQYRLLWLYHLTLLMTIPSLFEKMIKADTSGFQLGSSLLMICLYGLWVGSVMAGTTAKPLTFCLPDHSRKLRKMLFLVWLLMAIISLLIISMRYLSGIQIDPPIFIAYMALMSLSFWLGVAAIIKKLQLSFIFILIFALGLMLFKDTGTIVMTAFVNHPFLTALACGIPSYVIFHATGSRNNHRLLCASPWIGLGINQKSRQQLVKQSWMYINTKNSITKPVELFDIFFTERIRSTPRSGLMAHLWGQVYLLTAPIFSHWKWLWAPFLFTYVVFVLFPCFVVRMQAPASYGYDAIILIFFSTLFSIFFTNQRFKNFQIAGRRIHFFRGFVVLITTMCLSLGFLGGSILLFNFLSTVFPVITLSGTPYTIVSIPPFLLIIPLVMVPLFGGLFVLFRGVELKIALGVASLFALFVSLSGMPAMETIPPFLNFLIVMITAGITWGFHLAILYYTSMKGSLC